MNNYKFRGKDKDNNWHYGNLIHQDDLVMISNYVGGCRYSETVIPESVGQWTGLLDKNGKEIYSDDFIKCTIGCENIILKVIFDSGCFGVSLRDKFYALKFISKKEWEIEDIEVIGSIHDNPELLEDK